MKLKQVDPIMASTSTPSSSSVNWKYEVFLSFRGADLRKTFVDHLYAALDRCGIYAFKDDIRLQGGESISHQLLKAIERSRSAIVVFSSNYGSSGWCLDELEKIMECKEKLKLGLTVFPVFYDVDPSEVRRQSGTFGEGFAKAVERKADKADVWRKALQDAADLSGYNVRNTADGYVIFFFFTPISESSSISNGSEPAPCCGTSSPIAC